MGCIVRFSADFARSMGPVTEVLWRSVHVHSGVRHGSVDPDRVCPGQGEEDFSSHGSSACLRSQTASEGAPGEIQEAALSG